MVEKHTIESRGKISQTLRRLYSDGSRVKKSPMQGRTHSLETKERMRLSALKRIEKSPHTIPDNTGRIKEDAGYEALHAWAHKYFEKKITCQHCGATQHLDWASREGNYTRDRKDWLILCRKCHMAYDRENNIWKPERFRRK